MVADLLQGFHQSRGLPPRQLSQLIDLLLVTPQTLPKRGLGHRLYIPPPLETGYLHPQLGIIRIPMFGPVQLLPQLDHLRVSLVQLPLQSVQLGPLILHTPERNVEGHLRPSWDQSRKESGRKRRKGRSLTQSCGIAHLRDIHRLRHGRWPKSHSP